MKKGMKRPTVIIALVATLMLAEGLLFIIVTQVTSANPAWWDTNWAHRRQITVGLHPENYQIMIEIPSEIPKSYYPSIRFLEDENSGLLPYWIERDEGSYLNVAWVRRLENSDGYGGNNTIWMYYGKPGATSAENGDNVFLFFDDFGDNQLDTDKWGKSATGVDVFDYTLRLEDWSDQAAHVEHGPGQGLSTSEQNTRRIIEFRIKNFSTWRGGVRLEGPGWGEKEMWEIFNDNENNKLFSDNNWGSVALAGNKWWIGRMTLYAAGKDKIKPSIYYGEDNADYRQHVETLSDFSGDWAPDQGGWYFDKYKPKVWDGGGDSSYYYDWFFVRRYVETEPSVTVGSEESLPGQPLLYSPPNGATTLDDTPTFEWTIGENADNHRLLVDNDSDFSSPEEDAPFWASDNSYTAATPLSPDNYSWKVIAINTYGETESSVWTFVVVESWTGWATFELENLYKASLEEDLQLLAGSKLVVKFYKYDNTIQDNNIIDNVTPPENIKENENVPHPRGAERFPWGTVQVVKLVLTTDNTANEISEIASLTVHRIHLKDRYMEILVDWFPHPELHDAFRVELTDILVQWFPAPP